MLRFQQFFVSYVEFERNSDLNLLMESFKRRLTAVRFMVYISFSVYLKNMKTNSFQILDLKTKAIEQEYK